MFIKKLLLVISVFFCIGIFLFFLVENRDRISLDYKVVQDWNLKMEVISGKKKVVEEDLLFILDIPRIKLTEKVYTMDSGKNYVDYHVQILEGSNIDKNFLFLAAHSGNGVASYFNRLIELEKGDVIWLDRGYEKVYFVVDSLFYIQKNGYLEYSSLEKENNLYLITCSLEYSDKQLVVKATLVY